MFMRPFLFCAFSSNRFVLATKESQQFRTLCSFLERPNRKQLFSSQVHIRIEIEIVLCFEFHDCNSSV